MQLKCALYTQNVLAKSFFAMMCKLPFFFFNLSALIVQYPACVNAMW